MSCMSCVFALYVTLRFADILVILSRLLISVFSGGFPDLLRNFTTYFIVRFSLVDRIGICVSRLWRVRVVSGQGGA